MSSPQNGFALHPATAEVSPSGRSYVDSLISDVRWGEAGVPVALSYSFFPLAAASSAYWASAYSDRNEPSAASALAPMQKEVARDAIEAWSNVANVTFTEIATETVSSVGDIRIAWTGATNGGAAAWGYYPNDYFASGGDVWLSRPVMGSYPADEWEPGGGAYQTLIHEIGHALGLKHPFEDTPTLGDQDTEQYSVMSYTNHAHSTFLRITNTGSGYLASTETVEPETPMLYDIAAIQHLYGANTRHETGDNTYTFDPSTPFFRTIWDAGGTDTISVANFSRGCILDLRDGHYSKIAIESDALPAGVVWTTPPPTPTYDGTDNLAIAFGAVIENAVGGSGNDRLVANDAVNRLDGGSGRDTAVFGHAARNTVSKVVGGYTVTGAEGSDTLVNIERLEFSGGAKVALDLDDGLAANSTARLIGAGFGAANVTGQRAWVTAGLDLFDSGMTFAQVAELVTGLMAAASNAEFVTRVYTNVIGVAPGAAELELYGGMLEAGTSQAALLALAANTSYNAARINLTGLQQTGIDYA